jgi:hypothetical protein
VDEITPTSPALSATLSRIFSYADRDIIVLTVERPVAQFPGDAEDLFSVIRDVLLRVTSQEIADSETRTYFMRSSQVARRVARDDVTSMVNVPTREFAQDIDGFALPEVARLTAGLAFLYPIWMTPFLPRITGHFSQFVLSGCPTTFGR